MRVDEKPLITFALFAYNQESFIREAVDGALSQTYSPLEIIFSDDSSGDSTAEIIEEMVSKYTGPHSIKINRNANNLGIGNHINKVMSLARGDLIVAAAGDDISLPQRTATLADVWLQNNRSVDSIYSASYEIDKEGKDLGLLESSLVDLPFTENVRQRMPGTLGNSHAWSARVFEKFGAILPDTVYEDRVIPFRSYLLGGIKYVSTPLVKYRLHGSNLSHYQHIERKHVWDKTIELHLRNINVYENYLKDLRTMNESELSDGFAHGEVRVMLEKIVGEMKDKVSYLQGGRSKKLELIRLYIRANPRQSLIWFVMLLVPGIYTYFQLRKFRQHT